MFCWKVSFLEKSKTERLKKHYRNLQYRQSCYTAIVYEITPVITADYSHYLTSHRLKVCHAIEMLSKLIIQKKAVYTGLYKEEEIGIMT